MSLQRIPTWLVAGLMALLVGSPAVAQVQDMQFFNPAEVSQYGGGVRPHEGYFLNLEYLHWSIGRPDTTPIGFPGATRTVYYDTDVFAVQSNTHDNGWIGTPWSDGDRVEFGYIEGHHGWLFSNTFLGTAGSNHNARQMDVVFSDPPYGPSPGSQLLQGYVDSALTDIQNLPVSFTAPVITDDDDNPLPSWGARMENLIQTWSLELNYTYRFHPTHHGSIWELYMGVRYFEFNEEFNVRAFGGTLADSEWFSDVDNHIVGPQLGGRIFRTYNRWTFETQGRFFAGWNAQSVNLDGILGSQLDPSAGPVEDMPLAMGPTAFSHTEHVQEWSPGVELRFNLKYQLTEKMAISVGWTGFWIDGIARASNVIYYDVPDMGITMDRNRQDVFMNGVNVAVEFNH
ncbi:hypothetical protein JCM19992_12890 [Thermostilla marina]